MRTIMKPRKKLYFMECHVAGRQYHDASEVWDKLTIKNEQAMNTFIMMWNPAISSFKKEEFDKMVSSNWFQLNWSVWDHEKVEYNDRFYMVRVGEGNTGIVMAGKIESEAWEGEDWSGKGRKTFYVDLEIDTILDSDKVPYISTEELMKLLPGFDWTGGHSGRVLSNDMAKKLEVLWNEYLYGNQSAFDDINAQTCECWDEYAISDGPLHEYLEETHSNVCEICGYDYQKLWGRDCKNRNRYFAFWPDKKEKAEPKDFLNHVHCICSSCNQLPTEKLRAFFGERPMKEE